MKSNHKCVLNIKTVEEKRFHLFLEKNRCREPRQSCHFSPDGIHDLNSTGQKPGNTVYSASLVKLEQQPLTGNSYSLALSQLQS